MTAEIEVEPLALRGEGAGQRRLDAHGLLPGLLAITVGVPFPDVVSPVTTGVLAAIPAGVALGFAGRRLPYDPRARDRILAVLPVWVLDRQRSE